MGQDKKARRNLVNWLFKTVIVGWPLRLFSFAKVTSSYSLPEKGGFTVASNHISGIDPFLIAVYLRRYEFHWFAKHTLWKIPVVGVPFGWLLNMAGQIKMDRSNSQEAAKSIKRGAKVVQDGGVLAIFPESTRSPDGRLYKGYVGVARVAYASGTSVLIVAVVNAGHFFKRPKILTGPLINVPYVENPTAEQLRELTDHIMSEIQKLSSQEYVDRYATRHHK